MNTDAWFVRSLARGVWRRISPRLARNMTTLELRSRADSTSLKRAAKAIEHAAWNQLGYLNYTRSHHDFYDELLDRFPEYQLCLVDRDQNYPVAVASCVPISCPNIEDLPPEGWDWLVETAANSAGAEPNLLGALAISVPAVHRSKGYARLMISALRDLAASKGLSGVIAPVRPSQKSNHPFVPIEEYIRWTNEDGRLYDPWLRSHVASGGRVLRPCERSMVVEEHVAFWETWAGKRLEHSGNYALEGALAPVAVDLERQIGRYEEPNVWVVYSS
jgi:hypothetical protein